MDVLFCPYCGCDQVVNVVPTTEIHTVVGERIEILSHNFFCAECREEIINEKLIAKNRSDARRIYRDRHRLLQPDEVANIRKKYAVSTSLFSAILGFQKDRIKEIESDEVLHRKYEDALIRLMKDPQNFAETTLNCDASIVQKAGVDK